MMSIIKLFSLSQPIQKLEYVFVLKLSLKSLKSSIISKLEYFLMLS